MSSHDRIGVHLNVNSNAHVIINDAQEGGEGGGEVGVSDGIASARNVNSSANNSRQFDPNRLRIPDGHKFHGALVSNPFGSHGWSVRVGRTIFLGRMQRRLADGNAVRDLGSLSRILSLYGPHWDVSLSQIFCLRRKSTRSCC